MKDFTFANEWAEMEWFILVGLGILEEIPGGLQSYAAERHAIALVNISLEEDAELCWQLVVEAAQAGKVFAELNAELALL